MPRDKSTSRGKELVIPTTSLVASATRMPGKMQRIYQPRQDWQLECYRHYAICGEARFAANFFGNAMSRATLGTAVMEGGTPVRTTEGPAWDLLMELFSGKDGQVEMLNSLGVHLTIAGECYLVGRSVEGVDMWEIVSIVEMQVAGDAWSINYGDGLPPVMLTEDDVVIRIWTPNPAKRIEADSPFRSLLPILGEIEWLTRHVFAQITSRLASAGILFLPQGMTFPPPVEKEGAGVPANEATSFMLTLGDAMMTPLDDPSSPASIIPIVVTAPGEEIDKAKLLTFWSELDSEAKALREEAIKRFAIGMDLPPEQILGMASNGGTGGGNSNGVSHWGAWQIEESTIKMHIEPKLDVVVNALTIGYLRPLLADDNMSLVVYETTKLRLRPDRSKEAFELWDRGLLSNQRLLEENGFSVDDMPGVPEFKIWLLRKIAGGSATPEQVGAAMLQLGVDIGMPTTDEQTRETPQPPSLEEHPTRPRTPAEAASLLLAASEPLVFRALERAGNRLRQAGSRPPGVPAYETHVYVPANGSAASVMNDAWSCAHQTLSGVAEEPDHLIKVLDSYCMSLISNQQPHTRDALAKWLEAGACR